MKRKQWQPAGNTCQYGEDSVPVNFRLPESLYAQVKERADAAFDGNATKEIIRALARAYAWSPDNG